MDTYDYILEQLNNGKSINDIIYNNDDMDAFFQLSDLRKNLLVWYDFKDDASILEIGSECGIITGLLCKKVKSVVSYEKDCRKAEINRIINGQYENLEIISDDINRAGINRFDYVVIVGSLEKANDIFNNENPQKSLLEFARRRIKSDGKILVATDNRLGVRYFCGAPESNLKTYFTGINDYRGINNVRTLSKAEFVELCNSSGLIINKTFYPYPDYKTASEIFTDKSINTSLYGRPTTNYDGMYLNLIDENKLMQDLAKEEKASSFANSFLFELSEKQETETEIEYIKICSDRKEEFQIYTKVFWNDSKKMVSKHPQNEKALEHIIKMKYLQYNGEGYTILSDTSKNKGELCYQYLSFKNLDTKAFEYISHKDGTSVVDLFDQVKNIFIPDDKIVEMNPITNQDFVKVFGDYKNEFTFKCISNVCFDLILDNIFDVNGVLMVIDYEWFFEFAIPSEYLLWRSINELFFKYPDLHNLVNRVEVLDRFGIDNDRESLFRKWESHFLNVYVGGNKYSSFRKNKILFDLQKEAEERIEKEQPISELFLDDGEGYSEASKIIRKLSVNDLGYFEVSYDLGGIELQRLRWDPVRLPCNCHSVKIVINDQVVEKNAVNYVERIDQEDFYTDDPGYEINVDGDSINTVKIHGFLEIVDDDEYYDTVADIIHDQKNVINALKKESSDQRIILTSELNSAKRELNAYQSYVNQIRNSKLWYLYKSKKLIKKLAKKALKKNTFDIKDNKDDLRYSIEGLSYKNNVLSVGGWIFSSTSPIDSLYIVLKNDFESREIEIKNKYIRREDIKIAYNNASAYDSGFNENFEVTLSGKADVILRAIVNENEYLFRIGDICGTNDTEKISIDYYHRIVEGNSFIGMEDLVEYNNSTYEIDKPIDIIIPIYNGYEYLPKLLEDIRKTSVESNIYLINDKSTDERVLPHLTDYAREHENVTVLENKINLGFVKTVNKGLKLSENDVVLVNTDVELPEGWLERLMYPIVKYPEIASTTPFANSATIFSFPNFGENNPIYKDLSVEQIDNYFKKFKPRYTVVPTGMGFLMGMSRRAINEIGVFDERTYSKGFGEENDWCQRAIANNYYNVQVENLFAYHKHGGSFLSEDKQRLIKENSKKLATKYPKYFDDVARFCEKNPLDSYRKTIKNIIDLEQTNSVLVFNHALGGGADTYIKGQIRELRKDATVLEVRYLIDNASYELINHSNDSSVEYKSANDLFNALRYIDIKSVYINELVSYPHLFSLLERIRSFVKDKKSELIMLMHDYFAVSPTINLISVQNYNYSFDGENFDCDRFFVEDGYDKVYNCPSISEWRERWKSFLIECTDIRCFSDDTSRIINMIYPGLKRVSVHPHIVEYMLPVKRKRKTTKTLNIGLLGVLSRHKGKDIVKKLIRETEKRNLNIRFILVGTNDPSDPNPLEENEIFKITGQYYVEDLPRIVLENDIDIFFISSICPETFSYTAEEIMKMELPIACFNIGAPAERVAKYDKGLIIDQVKVDNILDSLVGFSYELKIYDEIKEETRRVLCIAEYISFSSRYRMDHFQEELILDGIESDYINVDELDSISDEDLNNYSHVFIYRCRYKDKLIPFMERVKGKKTIIYDIDDYIYDYEKIKEESFLKDSEYDDFEVYSGQIKECMEQSDIITTSTNTLANVIRTDFPSKKVIINRNVASMAMMILSRKAVLNKSSHEGLVLGYFSGSKTHNDDFRMIEDPILTVMKSNPDVRLLLVGCIETSEILDEVKDRIEKIDFVDWRKLPELLSKVDINLMPLVDSFFNLCKSENKWMEAALVNTATIASYNEEINAVAMDKNNIDLNRESFEWIESINKVFDRKDRIAENAFLFVVDNKTTISCNSIVNSILL